MPLTRRSHIGSHPTPVLESVRTGRGDAVVAATVCGALKTSMMCFKMHRHDECLNSNDPEYVTQDCIWLRKGYAQCRRDLMNRHRIWQRGNRSADCVGKSSKDLFSYVAASLGWKEVDLPDAKVRPSIFCVMQSADLLKRLPLSPQSWASRYLGAPDVCDKGNFARMLRATRSLCCLIEHKRIVSTRFQHKLPKLWSRSTSANLCSWAASSLTCACTSWWQGGALILHQWFSFEYPDFNPDAFYHDVQVIAQRSLALMAPVLLSGSRPEAGSERRLFQIFGFDIMLDNKYKAYLLEVNNSPSLCIDEALPVDGRASELDGRASKTREKDTRQRLHRLVRNPPK
eukprot:g1472.t1